MQRKRRLSGCKDEREVACRRKAVGEGRTGITSGVPCSMVNVSPLSDDEYDYCPVNVDREEDMDCITCKLCCHCIYEPMALNCGHSFCKCCITDHLVNDATCPVCLTPASCVAPDEHVQEKVTGIFPNFCALRETLTLAMQKRMFLELFHLRSRLDDLKSMYTSCHVEKCAALNELKRFFYTFYDAYLEEQMLEKSYREGVKSLDNQHKIGAVIGMRAEGAHADDLPSSPCCLETLISHLDTELLKSPDELVSTYDRFLNNGVSFGSPLVKRCGVCGREVQMVKTIALFMQSNGGDDMHLTSSEVFAPRPSYLV